MNRLTLIIPAAGSGSRLKKEVPKPYIKIAGRTILEHTVNRFLEVDALSEIIIATSRPHIPEAKEILQGIIPSAISFKIIEGGKERQHSIYHALEQSSESELIIIHDAVRPFVAAGDITKCCKAALEVGAAILGIPAKDTIKRIDENRIIRETPSRKYLWQAQTPQVFKTSVIKEAFQRAFDDGYIGTDDASLVERMGHPVKVVEGERTNFKITYPLDLKLAQLLLEQSQ